MPSAADEDPILQVILQSCTTCLQVMALPAVLYPACLCVLIVTVLSCTAGAPVHAQISISAS